jgi:hypothetical protein
VEKLDERYTMGIGFGNRSSSGNYISPNPHPCRFKILDMYSYDGTHTVVRIKYFGCTTYGGEKLAVYKLSPKELESKTCLDPHFLEKGLSPIARFPASTEGMRHADIFLNALMEIN